MSKKKEKKHPKISGWLALPVNDEWGYPDDPAILSEVKSVFGSKIETYIPKHVEKVRTKSIEFSLFDGYVFVNLSSCDKAHQSLQSITGNRLLGKPLKEGGNYFTVSDKEIERYRALAVEKSVTYRPSIGDVVIPKTGTFSNIDGVVVGIEEDSKKAIIEFMMPSRTVTASITFVNLAPYDPRNDDVRASDISIKMKSPHKKSGRLLPNFDDLDNLAAY